jgi:hypothetical protein
MQGKKVYKKKERTSTARRRPVNDSALTEFSLVDEQDRDSDMRQLISLYYLRILRAPPPEDWHGEGGTVSMICEAMKMSKNQRRMIHKVISVTHQCLMTGETYEPMRASVPGTTAIKDGSREQQLIADYRERGLSFTETTMLVNRWCHRNGHESVTRSAVRTCEMKMVKQITTIQKRPQGTNDKDSTWARARYRWVTQILIRLGLHDHAENVQEGAVKLDLLKNADNELPDYFNPYELTSLHLRAIAWWDEVHKDCFLGDFREGQSSQTRFPRDASGQYDPLGEYRAEKSLLVVKFSKQTRLCLGVAVREADGGEEEGVRLTPFDYTEKNIITMKNESEIMQKEIARVKNLPRTTKSWTSHPDADDFLFTSDPISKVKGISTAKSVLLEARGIKTVNDLLNLNSDAIAFKRIVQSSKGIGRKGLQSIINNCSQAQSGIHPAVDYYIDSPNPYAAKYGVEKDEWGEERWKVEARKSSAFSGCISITELVKHIVLETQKCFKDTNYKDTYHFYHDALTQLTNEETVSWMKETKVPGESSTIYQRWIKPENGLNDEFGKRWWGRPIGNSPELMPLDNSLNQDVHESVRTHVIVSLAAVSDDKRDPRLFSTATPKLGSSAYRRVFCPETGVSPRPDRIIQDVHKVVHACKEIHAAKGVYVPGLAGGRVPGHRYTSTSKKTSENHGGRRQKKQYDPASLESHLHTDLRTLLNESRGVSAFFEASDDSSEGEEEGDGGESE